MRIAYLHGKVFNPFSQMSLRELRLTYSDIQKTTEVAMRAKATF
jgi:hypothetical protein